MCTSLKIYKKPALLLLVKSYHSLPPFSLMNDSLRILKGQWAEQQVYYRVYIKQQAAEVSIFGEGLAWLE